MNLTSMGLIEYMNKNISCLISATLQAQHGLLTDDIEVTALEVDGYFVKSDGKTYFITFDKSCETLHDFKNEMLIHVRNYRRFLM